jgi:glycosyltransferase involved in cell wall biosynthesis
MTTIYINGRFLTQRLTGVQRYARQIVEALDRAALTGPPMILLAPAGTEFPLLQHIQTRHVGISRGHLWDQTEFCWAARDGVALSLASTGPVLHPNTAVAIHDAAIFRVPDAFSRTYRLAHKTLGWLLSKRSRLITVSEFSRSELHSVFGVPQDQILVAPNGHEHLSVTPDQAIVSKLGLDGQPYFLMLGSLTRNKNLALAVKALNHLPQGSARIVMVGDPQASVFGPLPLPDSADLVIAGRRTDAEIAGLMRAATAFVFPSRYEGFGIPPLEAMANDCPVLASTAAAVVETCGDAAEYFAAADETTLAQLMQHAVNDQAGGQAWRMGNVCRKDSRAVRGSGGSETR